ncbi:TetR/AcrR family transcriptional regulator [Nocardioides acrostichi]|uniref:TetR/AcrR family transcriptional regulator n=1 Tax=Nocardioides acrostichi TaxID=2784339 RepID=A0A930UYW3_9ACTN|nr:TetR/AcrR family transcriptional regulator [Nocardioides acrostichi]MBF4160786.1 TetR/AcrR family transcriptional regulator [Nocardioides acrostichi]
MSPVRRPPRSDARAHRSAIVEASQEVLRDVGPDFSMGQVAGAAGVSRTTVYRHFADREALLDALVVVMAQRHLPEVVAVLGRGTLEDSVDAFARSVLERAAQERALVRAAGPRLEALTRLAVIDEPMVALLARRRTRGEHRSALPERYLVSCVRALVVSAVLDERPVDPAATELATALRLLLGLPPHG